VTRSRLLIASALGVLLALAAWPALAHPNDAQLELVGTTRDYLVVLRVGPPTAEAEGPGGIVLCGIPVEGADSP
jgi:hypothetical protein